MKRYSVRAISTSGETVHLSREADCEDDVAIEIMREGMTPTSIVHRDGRLLELLNRPLTAHAKPSLGDLALFCEQLGAMTESGLTVEQALRVLSRQHAARHSTKMARRLLDRVQGGMALSAGLAHEQRLPVYLAGMIRAAETGGNLTNGLGEAARYLQRQADTRGSLINALTYPAVVLLTVLLALVLVLALVIPAFEPIFAGEEHRLPTITRAVLVLSDLVVHRLPHVVMILTALVLAGIGILFRFPNLRIRLQAALRRLRPVRLASQLDVARMLGVLGMLFQSGVEASEAVSLAAKASGSTPLRKAMEGACRQLREGASISNALADVQAIPEDTRALIEVGEHTGDLGKTTLRAAQLLEADTAHQIGRLVALANPIAIALLGVIVGLVVGGVMLGILSINQLALKG